MTNHPIYCFFWVSHCLLWECQVDGPGRIHSFLLAHVEGFSVGEVNLSIKWLDWDFGKIESPGWWQILELPKKSLLQLKESFPKDV